VDGERTVLKRLGLCVLAALGSGLAGCASNPNGQTQDLSSNRLCLTSPTPSCLVQQATDIAATTLMGADRVTTFIEISNAAHARGRDDEARDTLARALTAATEINEPKAEASALLRIADAQAAPRERIAALARVARMVDDAKMKSLPRYL